ncbi:hypothetical protein [Roseiarcus sp.]|uniref:hypothetical protein n=1 Tax=Roseiarcus sp. TaxID=1969460 RepID=UPI003D0D97C0
MTGRGKPTTIVKAFVANFFIFVLSVGAVLAADLTNPPPAPPSPAPEAAPHWYVKLGALGALDQSWSSLFAQQVVDLRGRLFLYPELVLGGRRRSSPLAEHKDHRILGYAAIFRS